MPGHVVGTGVVAVLFVGGGGLVVVVVVVVVDSGEESTVVCCSVATAAVVVVGWVGRVVVIIVVGAAMVATVSTGCASALAAEAEAAAPANWASLTRFTVPPAPNGEIEVARIADPRALSNNSARTRTATQSRMAAPIYPCWSREGAPFAEVRLVAVGLEALVMLAASISSETSRRCHRLAKGKRSEGVLE